MQETLSNNFEKKRRANSDKELNEISKHMKDMLIKWINKQSNEGD